jgi:hypothetical protein
MVRDWHMNGKKQLKARDMVHDVQSHWRFEEEAGAERLQRPYFIGFTS